MNHSIQEFCASPSLPMVVPNSNEVVPSPIVGKPKSRVELECLVQSLFQLPPSIKWTHSRSIKKKEHPSILKETCDKLVTIDLDLREEPFVEILSGQMEQVNQRMMEGSNTLCSMVLNSSPVVQTLPPKEYPSIPNWSDLFVSKERSIVPTTLLVGDMVRKCLGKSPKAKKEKKLRLY